MAEPQRFPQFFERRRMMSEDYDWSAHRQATDIGAAGVR
jgi:hypothetical protein